MLWRTLQPRGLTGSLRRISPVCSSISSQKPWLNRGGRTARPNLASHSRLRLYSASASGFSPIDDTVYALSTAQGRAAIAVIRVSGPSCLDVYKALCPGKVVPRPRVATVRSLYDPEASSADASAVLDAEALVLYFPGPRTVTGDDVLELHVHGGPATVKSVLSAVPRCIPTPSDGEGPPRIVRYAEPGEFTKRGFVNGRLDLAQIESLSDTLAAETEQQRRAAVRGNSGRLGRTYDGWREQLIYARGEIEALIDFSEDQHFDEPQSELLSSVTSQIESMLHSINLHEQGSQRSELLRGGIRIALLGPPNVGKSSLMNLVVGREASIVSGEAGTTRDIVEASLDMRGYLCCFADTAGVRSSGDDGSVGAIEEEGIRRAMKKAREADVVIVLASVEQGPGGPAICFDERTLDLAAQAKSSIAVLNKIDAVSPEILKTLIDEFQQTVAKWSPELAAGGVVGISCRQAEAAGSVVGAKDLGGIQSLIDGLVSCFSRMTAMPVDMQDLLGVTERQRQLLVKCRGHLEDFMAEARPDDDSERDSDAVLAAEHLRYAANCLSRITGRGDAGDVEDVLGVVFEK
ncbi:tRNA modification GTPase [Geosmithia morbida]|uniref:tRNA modification GTPase n=1 Tax=Geosmithia morbida TaxID=1094350 RepID=A0A9P4YPL7_9HYPO|nr:tRNA modification GTPase [Geosmithia morbida]KAF4120801.1 tRNA modification GTPase [Geosmithia morbida]